MTLTRIHTHIHTQTVKPVPSIPCLAHNMIRLLSDRCALTILKPCFLRFNPSERNLHRTVYAGIQRKRQRRMQRTLIRDAKEALEDYK